MNSSFTDLPVSGVLRVFFAIAVSGGEAEPLADAMPTTVGPVYNEYWADLLVSLGEADRALEELAWRGEAGLLRRTVERAEAAGNNAVRAELQVLLIELASAPPRIGLARAQTVLAAGADPNTWNAQALRAAVQEEHPAMVTLLLEWGARPEDTGEHLVDLALATQHNFHTARALIRGGVQPFSPVSYGWVAQNLASSGHGPEAIRALAATGLDASGQDGARALRHTVSDPDNWRTPAAQLMYNDIGLALLEVGADPTRLRNLALADAADSGNLVMVRALLDGGADPAVVGYTMRRRLSRDGEVGAEIVRLVVQAESARRMTFLRGLRDAAR